MRSLLFATTFLLLVCNTYGQTTSTLFSQLPGRQTGIDFVNEVRENDALNVLAYEYFYNGGGVAIGDINNDGLPDIFFTANLKPNKIYLNKGNFQFDDITKSAKLSGRKDWKTGVTMVDINGDGWLDIYVCYSGKGAPKTRRNELYINNRDLTFSEKAEEFGLADTGCSTQAIFFDYDLDGDLDCYVLNHNIKAYKNYELQYLKTDYDELAADRLYRNDGGKFSDVSKVAGITGNPISFGLGIAVSDINNDGWPDFYVSNDYTEQDYCYINNGNGSFSQRELFMFSHLSQFSMGSDIADINNDGLVDIFTLDMLPADNRRQKLLQSQENYELYQGMATNGFHYQFMRNMLHLNNGNGTFSEIGQLAGISNTDWSWAPLFADFDNDGFKDLYVTNGYMRDYTNRDFLKYWGDYLVKQVVKRDSIDYMDIIKMMPITLLPNYAFRNSADLTFKDVSSEWGLKQFALSNGAAYADLDNDGDLDLVINNINAPAGIYRNELEKQSPGNFLKLKLQGNGSNSMGIGTKIFCYTKSGMQLLEQMPTRGYQSSVSEVIHVGLGSVDLVDSLKIIWPDGFTEVQQSIKPNQTITLQQKNAARIPAYSKALAKKIFSPQKPLIDFSHLQLEYNDFKRQPLMPSMLSQCGPRFQIGDLDKDGREDIFIGCSQGQGTELHLQKAVGSFARQSIPDFIADSFSTTTGVVFFDADGDKDIDIYATSGGYADYVSGDERLQDRLFLNNGKGFFSKADEALPKIFESKSCVAVLDADGDGDMDIFLGARVKPGEYPDSPGCYLLLNNGKGRFTDGSAQWLTALNFKGLITDVKSIDIDKDNRTDLVLVGEWSAPMVLINKGDQFQPADVGLNDYSGWWNAIELFDADSDGDMDMIAGNWGLNTQLKASKTEPVELFWKDFDNNGSIDPFLCYYIQGKSYPFVSRDELLDQVYPMRRKFTSYKAYADATINDLFSVEELKTANHLQANQLSTSYFENRDGHFFIRTLPIQAQFSPVYKIVVEDWNHDGLPDLLLMGNNDYARLKMGKVDANFGIVLLNDGKGNFHNLECKDSGLLIAGDVKDAAVINVGPDKILLIGINNKGWLNYKWNP